MDPAVRLALRKVSHTFPDGTRALVGIDLQVRGGELIGVLGANGSGKTTLLTIMDGLERGYQGSVLLDGTEIRELSARRIYGKMGLVFQNPDAQLFAGSVWEDVAFGPQNMGFGKGEVEERVASALRAVQMEEHARRPIHRLSFGQKKRVCIAGLLSMGHEILLLDEPTAGLDPLGEHRMMGLLTKLNREDGVTIVMATHSVELVPLFLSRLLVLSEGRIKRCGTPAEVFTDPGDMADVQLKLPAIAEVIWQLREEHGMTFEGLPLTVGEARRILLEKLDNGRKG